MLGCVGLLRRCQRQPPICLSGVPLRVSDLTVGCIHSWIRQQIQLSIRCEKTVMHHFHSVSRGKPCGFSSPCLSLSLSLSLSLYLWELLKLNFYKWQFVVVTLRAIASGVKLYDYRDSKSPGDFNRLAEASRKRHQDSWQANAVCRHESLSIACVF